MRLHGDLLISSEFKECKAYWQWAQMNPLLREYLIKNVNEGKRSVAYIRASMAIGMRPGLPDYHLPLPNNHWFGLWLEIKALDQKGKKNRENQDAWINRLNKAKQYATYAYGWEEAAKITSDYLENRI